MPYIYTRCYYYTILLHAMVHLIEHAPHEDEHVLITACLARDLKDKPSYTGHWTNDEQKYELTKAYAQVMATRLKGKPLMTEHYEENGAIGEIVHCWIDDEKNEWHMQAVIDTNSRAGMDIVNGMLDEDNPFGDRIGEVSLASEGFDVVEASVVKRGARPGSTIDKVQLVTKAQLEAIKKQEYKMNLANIPDYIPQTGAPRICASFNHEMSTYTAVRNPAPPTTYAQQEHAPSEAAPIIGQVEQMRLKNLQMQQQQQQAQQQAGQQAGQSAHRLRSRNSRLTPFLSSSSSHRRPRSSSSRILPTSSSSRLLRTIPRTRATSTRCIPTPMTTN